MHIFIGKNKKCATLITCKNISWKQSDHQWDETSNLKKLKDYIIILFLNTFIFQKQCLNLLLLQEAIKMKSHTCIAEQHVWKKSLNSIIWFLVKILSPIALQKMQKCSIYAMQYILCRSAMAEIILAAQFLCFSEKLKNITCVVSEIIDSFQSS